MALTELEVGIVNQSLDKIGSKSMTYATQTDVIGVRGNLHYAQTRDALLRLFPWNFAKKRFRLVSAWVTATYYYVGEYVFAPYKSYDIATATVGGAGAGIFTITSTTDISSLFAAGNTFYVAGSTGNDKTYTVSTATYASPTLTIVPVEAVADGTDDGIIVIASSSLLYKCATANTSGYFYTDLGASKWTLVTTRPVCEWDYQYDMPSDFLRFLESNYDVEYYYTIEGKKMFTNESDMNILYIYQVTDTTLWDTLFTEIMILQLALKFINALAGTKNESLKNDIKMDLRELLARAKSINNSEYKPTGNSNWNDARYGSGLV